MKKIFSYERSNDEVENAIVDTAIELARQSYEGKKVADYEARNKELLTSMGKKMVEGTRYEAKFEAEGLEMFKSKQAENDVNIRNNFSYVLSQVVTAVVPEVVND